MMLPPLMAILGWQLTLLESRRPLRLMPQRMLLPQNLRLEERRRLKLLLIPRQ